MCAPQHLSRILLHLIQHSVTRSIKRIICVNRYKDETKQKKKNSPKTTFCITEEEPCELGFMHCALEFHKWQHWHVFREVWLRSDSSSPILIFDWVQAQRRQRTWSQWKFSSKALDYVWVFRKWMRSPFIDKFTEHFDKVVISYCFSTSTKWALMVMSTLLMS